MRRDKTDAPPRESVVKFWSNVDEMYWQLLPPASTGSLAFLHHCHPTFHSFDTPPIMLRKNATFELVLALESRWEYVTSLYGQLNVLQREERVLIDKLFYLLGHYQEAAV